MPETTDQEPPLKRPRVGDDQPEETTELPPATMVESPAPEPEPVLPAVPTSNSNTPPPPLKETPQDAAPQPSKAGEGSTEGDQVLDKAVSTTHTAGAEDDESDEDLFGGGENEEDTPGALTNADEDTPGTNEVQESEEKHIKIPLEEKSLDGTAKEPEITSEANLHPPSGAPAQTSSLNAQATIPPGNPPLPGENMSMNVGSDSITNDQQKSDDTASTKPEPAIASSIELVIPRKSPSKSASSELSIPRKSPSKSNSQPNFRPAPHPAAPSKAVSGQNTLVDGALYGLPKGVWVPQTIVRNRLFESEMNSPGSKLMEIIKSLPVNLINDALVEYDDAVDIKGTTAIRNHGAYLFGVVKRYVSVHERAMSGEGAGILPMGSGVTSIIEQRLEGLVSSGFCTAQEMNEKVKSKIRMLSEKDALFALDELSSVDRSSIRNFGSYFMGILNRYMRGDLTSKARPRPSPQSSSSPNQHGPENGPPHQRRNDDGNRPWQSQHNSMLPPGPQPNQYPPHRGGQMNQHGFGPGPSHSSYQHQPNMPPQHRPPQFNPQPPFAPQPPHGFPPMQTNMGGGNFAMQGHQQMQGSNNYQQNHTNPMTGGGGISGQHQQYGGQQQFQQSFHPQSPTMNQPPMGAPQMNQPPMGGHFQQPQPSNMPMNQRPQQPYGQQQQYGLQQQQQQPQVWQPQKQEAAPPIDIFGLADKAASAIQAMGGGQNMSHQSFGHPHQGFPPPQQQHQQGFISPQYGNGMPAQQQQQQQPYQAQPPGGFGQMPPIGVYNQNPPMQQAQGMVQGKRRTTATVHDLPGSVQFALQNLVATGALDALPDEGIMGMIYDLPEGLAIASLQKFDILDKTSMRNRMAYLAGVLRRELEKINRR